MLLQGTALMEHRTFWIGCTKIGTMPRKEQMECERLQGLPDGWTKGGSNTARYKAIGNGMAQPCADFVMWCAMKILEEK